MGARYTTVVKALNSNTSVDKGQIERNSPELFCFCRKRFAVN